MKVVWNAPNIISALRLACIPVLLASLIAGDRTVFTWILIPALISDIVDGMLARLFNQRTEAGAVLDSTADLLLTLTGVAGIVRFEPAVLSDHTWGLGGLVLLYAVDTGYALSKYGGLPGFHTWGCRITAYVQGFWIGSLFIWGFQRWLYVPMVGVTVLAYAEEMALIYRLKKPIRDARGIWWVTRKTNRRSRR